MKEKSKNKEDAARGRTGPPGSMKSFLIAENDAGQRLDKFLQKSVPLLPKSLLYKSIRTKRIKRNGKRAALNDRLEPGDRIDLYLNDEFFEARPDHLFLSVPARIDVVYEDEQVLLVNKPQGLVVHEDNDNTADTLINRVLHYLYNTGAYDPEQELSFTPALANRIDRNTCGIVLVAKTAAALRVLNEKLKHREITKQYLCLLAGRPEPPAATVTHYMKKHAGDRMVTVQDHPGPETRTMVTQYRVLETRGGISLAEVTLHTGRTHQIRAHMAYLGTPLLGDGKYGLGEINRKYGYRHQALCAWRVQFDFQTDAGVLEYLKGKSFQVGDIWFVREFREGKLR